VLYVFCPCTRHLAHQQITLSVFVLLFLIKKIANCLHSLLLPVALSGITVVIWIDCPHMLANLLQWCSLPSFVQHRPLINSKFLNGVLNLGGDGRSKLLAYLVAHLVSSYSGLKTPNFSSSETHMFCKTCERK